ncbi:MAG TPA: 3-phosphoshikimate 1-carboxyvinyltransferase [Thermoanaerobaculia bacterium]|nr:3-phosphoshikimate 1-carboxyvinyltransferase [Thermoanaerobaculia bacterium]
MTGWPSTPSEAQEIPSGGQARGRVQVPASKSLTHRYLNLALLARRPLIVERPLLADDTRLFLAALAQCGWAVEESPDEIRLAPPGAAPPAGDDRAGAPPVGDDLPGAPPAGDDHPGAPPVGGALPPREIFCGNAGTMLRFLVASLAALPGRWRLDGVARLRERPVGPLVEALRRLGAEVRELGAAGRVPLEIAGGTLGGGATRLDAGDSSQFLSALLMAGLAAPRPLTVEVMALTSAPYVEVTLAAARRCGGRIEALRGEDGSLQYRVLPGLSPPPRLRVEGDASAACYPAAAAALTGGRVLLQGLAAESPQGDRRFLELLARMGAEVAWHGDEVEVRGGSLQAVEADLSAMPDQVPTLAALAPFARGTTRIRNVAHLRLKESDRLSAMAGELRRLGAEVEEGADRLDVAGTWCDAPPPGDRIAVDSHGDHRIAMSLALVGLRRPGVVVGSPEVVAKSYPAFWQDFLGLLG